MDDNAVLQHLASRAEQATLYDASTFYRNAAILFASILIVSLTTGYFCYDQTFLVDRLLPAPKSIFSWRAKASSDSAFGGFSVIRIIGVSQDLHYSFTASSKVAHSFASVDMYFSSEDMPLIDLSKYSGLRFNVRCSPKNVLSFTARTFDKNLTVPDDSLTYRIPTAFFDCDEQWSPVEINLKHMEIPDWWIYMHRFALSDRSYDLAAVSSFSFGISPQSPKDLSSTVKIADLELVGRDWRFVYFFGGFAALLWLGYGIWFVKQHTQVLVAGLREKMQKDRPVIAYQQLSVEPHRDKERSAVLRYMATEYADPDMNLETAIATLGINRAKINGILKEEIGLTFSAYINKLRLTEAARLLAEKPEASVAEIAFSVGYNNVSYFNKLFKNEYGCSPKIFKSVYPSESPRAADPDTDMNSVNTPS